MNMEQAAALGGVVEEIMRLIVEEESPDVGLISLVATLVESYENDWENDWEYEE